MKRLSGILFILLFAATLNGQRNADYGVMGGVTSYLGDINPNRLLYSPGPSAGIFYRYNFHPRQSLRGNLLIGRIKGDDLDFNSDFQVVRQASFSGSLMEMVVQYEFNFFPYSTMGKLWNYTPYFAAGLGGTFINSHGSSIGGPNSTSAFVPVIPFSVGFKINVHKNIGLEAEYGFRKTFYDNFDGLKDLVAPSDYAWTHNNDWYTFTGVAVTWKFYSKLAGCPAYNDVDSKRKR
ncbi:MAG: outer membrane beta-barrel protein [Bacteroidales bacterium]|nr:outer membrane beta-barrel protein [Bacteroidales bacterium]